MGLVSLSQEQSADETVMSMLIVPQRAMIAEGTTMRILVTAGPTREAIDPVRYLSNRSSGKMGYAVARCAAARGHNVRLVSGPVFLEPPVGVELCPVVSAADMLKAVMESMAWCNVLIMAAAVADWRPRTVSPQKLKKGDGSLAMELKLEPVPDILQAVQSVKGDRLIVGFAAETRDLMSEARAKLARKGLDMIVANDVTEPGAGFEVDTNRVVFIAPGGEPISLPLMSKDDVAARIMDWVECHGRHT
jgi:phosphopantothenoylcysteine decarboxylase/phosphopantothenate--cysteine ligase